MPTVRKRRSRKNARINKTRYGSRLKKRNSKDVKSKIHLECIRERWDSKKTLKQNLMELGLSFDPNKSIPVCKPQLQNTMEESHLPQKTTSSVQAMEQNDLITELEAIAANVPPSKPFIMSPSEAKFIAYLIVKYGTNYKKMVKDKKNYNQLTEGQIKKKCLYFHKSSYVYLLDSDF